MKLQVVDEIEQDELHEANGVAVADAEVPDEVASDPGTDDDTEDDSGIVVPDPEDIADQDGDTDGNDGDESTEPEPEPESETANEDIAAEEMPTPPTEATPSTEERIQPPPEPPAASMSPSFPSLWEKHVNEIRDQRRVIAAAERDFEESAKETKAKKKAFELAQADLCEIIDRGPNQPSLFGKVAESPPVPAASTPTINGEPVHASDPPPVPGDRDNDSADLPASTDAAWRSLPWNECLTLSKTLHRRVGQLCNLNELKTMGQLCEWWQVNGGTDAPLGCMLVDHARQIGDAIDQFCKEADANCKNSTEIATAAPDDDSWRSTPIVELEILGLSKSIIQKLLDAGISTMGELADWSTETRKLEDIKGIGAKAADKISDATIRFYAEREKG